MGSKSAWGAGIGTVLAPGLGTAAGYAIGKKLDDRDKKSRRKAAAVEEGAAAEDDTEGDQYAGVLAEKKRKINTLYANGGVGALSGAGRSHGALTLGS